MGLKAVQAGEKAKEVRSKRYETALNVVGLTKKLGLDFVIIAGDTFEYYDVDEIVVKRTVDILNKFSPIPVYILPGNHDPLIPGSIWDRKSWNQIGSHVHLITEEKEINIFDDVVLYPCPIKQKRSSVDPTAWIPKREANDKRIRIGIAHGSLDILPESINFPISKMRAELTGLDYLALGDWHSFSQYERTIYSGTIEPTSFGETNAGNVITVDIPAFGVLPKIEKHVCRTITWAELTPDIHDITDVEHLEETIKELGQLSSLVLRIDPILSSCNDETAIGRLEDLRSELEDQALFLDWDFETSTLSFSGSASEIPEGILRRIDEALTDILEGKIPPAPCHTYANQDPSVVQTARSLLRSFSQRGRV